MPTTSDIIQSHSPARQMGVLSVLVVEDEDDLREAMVSYLNLEGFQADGVRSVAALKAWFNTHDCDIVLLDLGLPDGDGLNVLEVLRAGRLARQASHGSLGVIVVTAQGMVDDRIKGLMKGADAYMVKPVDSRELVAVIRSVAKRIGSASTNTWQFNSIAWTLQAPNSSILMNLSRSECVVIDVLMTFPGQAVHRDKIIIALGRDPLTYDPRRMEVLIRRLRNKAELTFGCPLPLTTVQGVGYAFTAPARMQTKPATDGRC